MTDKFEAEIQAVEGRLLLNGPRMWTDPKDGKVANLWVWTTLVRGQLLTAAFITDLGVEPSDVRFKTGVEQARKDLAYAVEYSTGGCMYGDEPRPHRFMGNPMDPTALLVCLDCGAKKKLGISLPGLVDMSGKKDREE